MFTFVRTILGRKAALAHLERAVKGIKRVEVKEELDLRVANPKVRKTQPSGLLGE